MLKKIFLLMLVFNINYLLASATSPGSYYISADKLNVRLDPSKNGKLTNSIYERQKVEVYEVFNGWARISPYYYYSGKKEGMSHSVARWVSAKYLSSKKPKKTTLKTNSPVAHAIAGSDDFSTHKAIFISVSEKLVKQRKCSIKDFKKMGGWMRSSKKGKYFTYCGGMSKANRLYLNVNTGKVSKD